MIGRASRKAMSAMRMSMQFKLGAESGSTGSFRSSAADVLKVGSRPDELDNGTHHRAWLPRRAWYRARFPEGPLVTVGTQLDGQVRLY